eukprot:9302753-Pyramimonas_sp.AAC.1
MFRGPRWNSTEAPSGTARMHPTPNVPFSPTQYSASWSHRELHRRPQWDRSHASHMPNLALPPTQCSVSWPHRELHRRP